jgi:hypothetical protein
VYGNNIIKETRMATTKEKQAEWYSENAKSLLLELHEQAEKVKAKHPESKPAKQTAIKAAQVGNYSVSTKVVFTGALVWERIQVCCSSTPAVMSTADIWGPTLAFGGISWGTSWFSIPPEQLPSLGDLTMQANIASVAVQISWWQNGSPIGTFVGGGVGIGGGVLGGTVNFQNGSC